MYYDDPRDRPPADGRFCPRCGLELTAENASFHEDELLGRYRTRINCPDCGYRGEVIRHDV